MKFLAFCLAVGVTQAQNVIVTPSPTAASIVNSVDIPAALYTGVPDISIPLFTIQGKKLTHPLSLNYQASGFKVTETGGSTGFGWSLNGAGMVTRVMRGRPDEGTNGYFQYASTVPDFQDIIPLSAKTDLATNQIDMLPDLFYYGTGADGGKFVFDNQSKPKLIPQKDIKITPNSLALASFEIISENGTKYIFTSGETTTVETLGGSFSYTSTWNLSKIISVDNTDTIKFNYAPLTSYNYSIAQNGFFYFFFMVPSGAYVSNHSMKYDSLAGQISVTGAQYLESVESSQQKIVFEFLTGGGLPRRLAKVLSYRKSPIDGALILEKGVNFSYSMFQDTDNAYRRMRLDSITEQAPNDALNPPYKFYYSTDRLPPPNSKAQDHWGYYNGVTSNTNLIPAMTVDGYIVSTNDREVHTGYVDGCILSKIVSPLGGSTEYFFDGNTYGSSNTPGPGLRVSRVVQKDPYSNINAVTNYLYTDPATGNSSGNLLEFPTYRATIDVRDNYYGSTLSYYCEVINVYATGAGTFANTPVVYEYVTAYSNDDMNIAGKTVNKFTVVTGTTQQYPFFPASDNSWQVGNPKENEAHKVVSGTPTIVSKTINGFSVGPNSTTIKGLRAAYNKILFGSLTATDADFIVQNCYEDSKFQYLGQSVDYIYEQNSGTLNLATTRNIFCDSTHLHLQPTRIVTTSSESGLWLQKEITYPFDYPATGIMGVMQNLHMKSYPVETRTVSKQGTTEHVIDYQKTDFNQWTTSGVYPQYVYRGKFSDKVLKSTFLADPSSYLQRVINFNAYNQHGFLTESQREGDIPSATVFDFQSGLETARILNARSDQVAHSSFESKTAGGWIVIAPNIIGSDAKTGTHCLVLSSGTPLYKTLLPAGNYTVSYFEKDGTVTCTLSGGATLLSSQTVAAGTDGWTLHLKHINVTGTGNTIELTGSNIKIDEARLYPTDAVISTTSRNELGLPTTVSDAQMNSRYFEYDEWGRVKVVRDRNKNIVEHYEYKLAGN